MTRPLIVIFGKAGQLGNRLFNFANFIAYAAEHGPMVLNPAFDEYAELFETTQRNLLCRYPSSKLLPSWLCNAKTRRVYYVLGHYLARVIRKLHITGGLAQVITLGDYEFYLLDDNAKALEPFQTSRMILVSGLQFRDIADMKRHRQAICAYFTPAKRFLKNIDSLINPIRETCQILIGVHIRRGDYAYHLGGQFFFDVRDYLHIMDKLEALFPNKRVAFLICSNESLANHFTDRRKHHFGTGHPLEDMYSLARCDYIIGPPSTYSLWASFYGEVPLFFLRDPAEPISLSRFIDYFLHVDGKEVFSDENGDQYVMVNSQRYRLIFRTQKAYLAL